MYSLDSLPCSFAVEMVEYNMTPLHAADSEPLSGWFFLLNASGLTAFSTRLLLNRTPLTSRKISNPDHCHDAYPIALRIGFCGRWLFASPSRHCLNALNFSTMLSWHVSRCWSWVSSAFTASRSMSNHLTKLDKEKRRDNLMLPSYWYYCFRSDYITCQSVTEDTFWWWFF